MRISISIYRKYFLNILTKNIFSDRGFDFAVGLLSNRSEFNSSIGAYEVNFVDIVNYKDDNGTKSNINSLLKNIYF
jgi:hypothetical protein